MMRSKSSPPVTSSLRFGNQTRDQSQTARRPEAQGGRAALTSRCTSSGATGTLQRTHSTASRVNESQMQQRS
eukprot:3370234-Rhodomonas_salina.1